jgi:hypothetical protein
MKKAKRSETERPNPGYLLQMEREHEIWQSQQQGRHEPQDQLQRVKQIQQLQEENACLAEALLQEERFLFETKCLVGLRQRQLTESSRRSAAFLREQRYLLDAAHKSQPMLQSNFGRVATIFQAEPSFLADLYGSGRCAMSIPNSTAALLTDISDPLLNVTSTRSLPSSLQETSLPNELTLANLAQGEEAAWLQLV